MKRKFLLAPLVVLGGAFTAKEGDFLNISCYYEDTFPFGNTSAFVVDGETHILKKVITLLCLFFIKIF